MPTQSDVGVRVGADIIPERPPIFDERNRQLWLAVRRLMVYILKELDKWYGWNSFME